MNEVNENHKVLLEAITKYCRALDGSDDLTPATMQPIEHELVESFKCAHPELAKTFDQNAPDDVFAENIIQRVVDTLEDSHTKWMWKHMYLMGASADEAAKHLNCSRNAIYRRKRKLPRVILRRLWELSNPVATKTGVVQTLEHRQIALLEERSRLTNRQAEVALALARPGPHKGLKQVAHELGISVDTLKKHIFNIRRKVGGTQAEAIDKIRKILRELPTIEL